MFTMNAVLATPIGDLQLIACEQGFVEIAFTEVSEGKDLELARIKLHEMTERPSGVNQPINPHSSPDATQQVHLVLPSMQTCKVIQPPSILGDNTTKAAAAKIAEMLENGLTQLTEYFEKERREFTLPLAASGTQFQQEVWLQLQQIPYGKFCSYGDIAIRIARPKAVRAVGAANGRNPLAIVVPCHRVIGQNHSMTGYAGGLSRKIWLLAHEKN